MGHLLGAITQDKLDAQRGVVLNEKRQGENQPYGRMQDLIAAATYPAGHPYSWTSIGSEADLQAATLGDVKQWFSEHYGAANAVLSIAGDVDPDHVKARVEHYFGHIPSGPPRVRHEAWVAPMRGTKRDILQDRVPQARVTQVWNVPGFCEHDANILSLSSAVLAGGKTSRLYERLVYRERIATHVSAHLGPFEIGSQFTVDAMVAPGADPAVVERAIQEEMARFLDKGPTADELERVRIGLEADFVRGLETIDGSGGKSATLAQYEVYCGSPDWYKREFQWIADATPATVRDVARRWLSDGRYVLTVLPFPERPVGKDQADRSQLPAVGEAPALSLPPLQRDRLSNGIEILVAERHAAPLVQLGVMFDAGYAADDREKPGTARMTLDMLSEGAGKYDSLGLARREEELAAAIGASSNLDTSLVLLNSLTRRLPESLDLLADVILRPTFPEQELERLKQQRLAAIQQEKSQPRGLATRIYPRLLYGPDHAYAGTRSGSGTEASVKAMTVADLRRFQAQWLRPDNARILVVGDTTLAQIKPLLEEAFGRWKAPGQEIPGKDLVKIALPPAPRLFLIDKPGAAQSLVLGAHLAPPKSHPDDTAMNLASSVLGGLFVSRLNMNLREEKHWSYGASSSLGSARGQRVFSVYAQVQTDRTADSIKEMLRELDDITGPRPVTEAELELAADNLVVGLPGDHETISDLARSYLDILQFGLADSYYNDLVPEVRSLGVDEVLAAARTLMHPQALTWVVVGDLAQIEAPLRALELGKVTVLNAEGEVLR